MADNFPSEVMKQVHGTMNNSPKRKSLDRAELCEFNYKESDHSKSAKADDPRDPSFDSKSTRHPFFQE